MKTTKLFLSIALVALTVTSFSQLSLKDRLFSRSNNEVAYFTADYKPESSKIENWMVDIRDWANSKVSRDTYVAPVVSCTYMMDQVEIIYEDEIGLESWMTVPFETGLEDEELNLESWMTAPFEAAEEIKIEEWMTAAFI